MERDANYVAVGAFVLLITAMAALFVYWYSDTRDQRTFNRYEIYFDGSVGGLGAGSQVRYLGVDVGRVCASSSIRAPPISSRSSSTSTPVRRSRRARSRSSLCRA